MTDFNLNLTYLNLIVIYFNLNVTYFNLSVTNSNMSATYLNLRVKRCSEALIHSSGRVFFVLGTFSF